MLPGWITVQVGSRLGPDRADDPEVQRVTAEVTRLVAQRLDELIVADVNEPRSGPLECIRQSLDPVTALLQGLAVDPAERDPFEERVRPDDPYALGPMSFLELGPEVHVAGIEWGAAKAFLHRRTNM